MLTTINIPKDQLDEWDILTDLEKEEVINDYLSDEFGFCVNCYFYEETEDNIEVTDIDWDLDNEEG